MDLKTRFPRRRQGRSSTICQRSRCGHRTTNRATLLRDGLSGGRHYPTAGVNPFWQTIWAVSPALLPAKVVISLNCSAVAPAATAS